MQPPAVGEGTNGDAQKQKASKDRTANSMEFAVSPGSTVYLQESALEMVGSLGQEKYRKAPLTMMIPVDIQGKSLIWNVLN